MMIASRTNAENYNIGFALPVKIVMPIDQNAGSGWLANAKGNLLKRVPAGDALYAAANNDAAMLMKWDESSTFNVDSARAIT